MRPLQIVLAPLALAACMTIDSGRAVQAQNMTPKKIVLPIKITTCTQYLELADAQQKNMDRKRETLERLEFERNVDIAVERGRYLAFVVSTQAASSDVMPTGAPLATPAERVAGVTKYDAGIKMINADLATGRRVLLVLEDAYRRCRAAPEALLAPPIAPLKAGTSTKKGK
jgi:hypothetical protein